MSCLFWEKRKYFKWLLIVKVLLLNVSMILKQLTHLLNQWNDFQKITLGLDYSESVAIYAEVHQRIEKCSETLYFLVVKVMPACVLLPKCLTCLYNYFTTDLGSEALVLPFPMWFVWRPFSLSNDNTYWSIKIEFFPFQRFPFDSKNLMGYLVAVALEYMGNVHLYVFSAEFTSLGLGAFLFTISMTEDIKNNLSSINKIVKNKRAPLEFNKKIRHCIQLNLDGRQLKANSIQKLFLFWKCNKISRFVFRLVQTFSNEIQPINVALYTWIFTAICGSLLMIQMELVELFFHFFYESIPVYCPILCFCFSHTQIPTSLFSSQWYFMHLLHSVWYLCHVKLDNG